MDRSSASAQGTASVHARWITHDGSYGAHVSFSHCIPERPRSTDSFDGVAYQQTFGTTEGEWITVDIPFADFTASFRGRRVPDAPALNPSNIRQIGFLIADRQTGPFALEIASISAYNAAD